MTPSEASSSDIFFFHDTMDISAQIEADLLAGLLQPRGGLYYNRSYGDDVVGMENHPNSIIQQILATFSVITFIGIRNMRVSNGTGGHPDRRVAASQDQITVELSGPEMNVSVSYVELRDLSSLRTTSTPIGGTR